MSFVCKLPIFLRKIAVRKPVLSLHEPLPFISERTRNKKNLVRFSKFFWILRKKKQKKHIAEFQIMRNGFHSNGKKRRTFSLFASRSFGRKRNKKRIRTLASCGIAHSNRIEKVCGIKIWLTKAVRNCCDGLISETWKSTELKKTKWQHRI